MLHCLFNTVLIYSSSLAKITQRDMEGLSKNLTIDFYSFLVDLFLSYAFTYGVENIIFFLVGTGINEI